jgi:hypothetical protein
VEKLPVHPEEADAWRRLFEWMEQQPAYRPTVEHPTRPPRNPSPDDLDQSPEFDPTEPEPIPEDDFDQTWGA